jgi:SAM-dependent methyltransferase
MNIVVEVIKNYLILLPPVRYWAKKSHRTGANNDEKIISERCDALLSIIPFQSSSAQLGDNSFNIAEFGPGQTIGLISELRRRTKSNHAFACDVECYFPLNFITQQGVDFIKSNQYSNGLPDSSVDFAYCFDVLEHVRKPKSFLQDVWRVMKPGGIFFATWDLRDHFFLSKEEMWFNMHRYSELNWWLMTSNRSNYVNRVDRKKWLDIITEVGFYIDDISIEQSRVARDSFFQAVGIQIDDAFRITATLSKSSVV